MEPSMADALHDLYWCIALAGVFGVAGYAVSKMGWPFGPP